jgi:hypothetical protein
VKLTSGGDPVTPDVTYKGYRIVVSKVGKGWRAMIYAPQSSSVPGESPTNLEQCSKEAIIADAKWIVDARCSPAPTR